MKEIVTIVFSKNRPLQLDLCLRSLLARSNASDVVVLYTTTSERYQKAYDHLDELWDQVEFFKQTNFKDNLLEILKDYQKVFFVVDDTVFIGNFSIADCVNQLNKDASLIGISLRLGTNTTYCYSMDRNQKVPFFYSYQKTLYKDLLKYKWGDTECDFGYCLELSSSIYRVSDLAQILSFTQYDNPNQLEWMMFLYSRSFLKIRPSLACFETSVAFSIPANKVQTENNNRVSDNKKYDPENLLDLFEKGWYIYLRIFEGFVPNSAHCEFDFLKEAS